MKDLTHDRAESTGQTGRVHLIGAGPGDPDLLTMRALRLIRSADIVVYDRLVSAEIMTLVPATTRRIDVGKIAGHHKVAQDQINALLVRLAQSGLVVARLKGGDPFIFGRGSEEAEVCRAAGVTCDVTPGITSAQGAASTTGVPLTHRGLATGVRFVTGHRAKDATLDLDWPSLASEETTLVVYMGVANIAEIAARLMENGLPADLPVLAVASATTPREMRVRSTLSAIAGQMVRTDPDAPVLFIIGHVVSLYEAGVLAAAETCPGVGMDAYA